MHLTLYSWHGYIGGSMERKALTAAMEDYLKAAYLLAERDEGITVLSLSQALGVTAPSVTAMVKRLVAIGLMAHQPYQAIALTPGGEAVALEVVRHHRLLELYLAEFLGVPWEAVHAEADRLEHHISEELEDRIADRLGQPSFDPHGDPIPTRELVLPARTLHPLGDLPPGTEALVARVAQQEPATLRYLEAIGLRPGTPVLLVSTVRSAGVVTLEVAGAQHTIGVDLAGRILVAPKSATDGVSI